ncbi:elongation factor G [Deinococcus radiophilus]|uniref:elongation factor G n=1 Tax=Deinococcus radiophilus TaxID=32062 RepID=UPI001E3564EF|nr:elongation factor G [Deinococcus radiophilus]UFA49973.1 elongation factor G [Deinococcus radiophilus]
MPNRVVSLVGHSGVGKTTLTEALLHRSGTIPRMGRVEDGTTQSDYSDVEHQHGFSVRTTVLRLNHEGVAMTLLDTPGYSDFVREIRGGIRAADSVLVMVGAGSSVEVGTERVWRMADLFGMPRIVAVNKMDRERAHFAAALADLRASLPGPVAAAFWPSGEGEEFRELINVLTVDPGSLSSDLRPAVAEARTALLDTIVEQDDALMNRYLEGEEISGEELYQTFLAAVHAGRIYPVLPVSAETGVGLDELLHLMVGGLRSARERGPLEGLDGQTRDPSPEAPVSARVWRVSVDPFVGKVAYLRVWSGILKAGDILQNTTRGEEVRLAHLYMPSGRDLTEVPELRAGMIGAVTKLDGLHTGDTLADPQHPIEYASLPLPDPVYIRALHPRSRSDEDRLGDALGKLLEEDPTLYSSREEQTGELLLGGMGEMHLNIAAERLAALNVNVDLRAPQIPYRETIRRRAQAQGKHKKQSGGHGQYGDCTVRIQPGEGYRFSSEVVGGTIPSKYLPSIEKGVQDALGRGSLGGFPVQDVYIAVLEGSHHEVDSSDLAFQLAGALALKNALEEAGPVLLEPVQLLRVRVPASFTGDIMSDLQARRGRVQGLEPEGSVVVISAAVPQREMQDYNAALRSLTGDRGGYSLRHHGYQELPGALAQQVLEERRRQLAEA